MSNCHDEGPEPQLCWWYPYECPRMAGVGEPEDTEGNYQEASANSDLPLPFDEGGEESKRKEDYQHGQ